MDLRTIDLPAPRFQVTLTLSVDDVEALWAAAATRGMQSPGATVADVLDTIGPREDPSIADCIAMLTAPSVVAGCALEDFAVEPQQEAYAAHAPILLQDVAAWPSAHAI